MRVLILTLLASSVCLANPTKTSKIECMGNLSVFGKKGGKTMQLNRDMLGFSKKQNALDSLHFGLRENAPFVSVYPWDGVDYKTHPQRYSKEFHVQVSSDGETYIEVSIKGKVTGHSESLRCYVL